MSTISVDSIKDRNGGNTAQINTYTPTESNMAGRNRLINGAFAVAQRGTSFVSGANDDDTYNLDRWYVLSDGNDAVDITQNTAAADTGDKYCLALDVETANKKFGIAQIIENINCADLQGQTVTLSFKAKVSATTKLDNVKCAIVAWSGTADTVTSDIVSAWNVEGTNPTLIANATYENTPANLNVTTSWARSSVSATIDTAGTNNVIVFIWSDVTDTTLGDFLYLANVQLEVGSVATPFERRPYGTELALCQRYFQFLGGVLEQAIGSGLSVSTSAGYFFVPFLMSMRSAPIVSFTNIKMTDSANYDSTVSSIGTSQIGTNSMRIAFNGTANMTQYRPAMVLPSATSGGLSLSSEL